MNKNNAKDYLPLVQALADGKTIQSKLSSCDSFSDCPENIVFGNPARMYRVKTEPREFWIVTHEYNSKSIHIFEDDANNAVCMKTDEIIKVREVLDDSSN